MATSDHSTPDDTDDDVTIRSGDIIRTDDGTYRISWYDETALYDRDASAFADLDEAKAKLASGEWERDGYDYRVCSRETLLVATQRLTDDLLDQLDTFSDTTDVDPGEPVHGLSSWDMTRYDATRELKAATTLFTRLGDAWAELSRR